MKDQLAFMDDDPSVLKEMGKIAKKLEELIDEVRTNKATLGQGYPEVLTLEQAASLLTLSDRHLANLREEEGLPSHSLGSRVVIIKSELLEWVAKRENKQ